MSAVIRSWRLANGLTVLGEDETVNYYGDYYNVRLVIRCQVTVRPEYLKPLRDNPSYDRVVEVLGPLAEYRREIVKAGVTGRDLNGIKEHLLQKFEETALPYFEREVFPERLVQKRFAEIAEDLSRRNRFDDASGN
jgi:hypothetical protein